MNRRQLLRTVALTGVFGLGRIGAAPASPASRIRVGEPGWPAEHEWEALRDALHGRLIKVDSPLSQCAAGAADGICTALPAELRNPYFLGDEVALTQTLGWVNAWTSRPSVYAVAAETSADVAAAVRFAKAHNLRLVVKGGGHSYQGTSNAPDSLLVWTRPMTNIVLHDAFVPTGCEGRVPPQPAVSIGAGALWGQVYEAVAVKGNRYVQGGGCLTVGVAGLVSGGGFGSLSKAFGTGAASLLEAEVVTADGGVHLVNACVDPDLFWALRGGGGGSFGVITRLTLRTYDLPNFIGGVFLKVKAKSERAYRALIDKVISFYRESLFNSHWGEQLVFRPDNTLQVSMVFQGLTQSEANSVWQPFLEGLTANSSDYDIVSPPQILAVSARRFWDPDFLKSLPGSVLVDDRPDAPASNVFWASNQNEAGQVLHAYRSAWLSAVLLEAGQKTELVEALFEASRHWPISLHLNKGLAGGAPDAIAATGETAMNPAVLDAFALLICAAGEPPAYPGWPGHEPDIDLAKRHAAAVEAAMGPIQQIAPSSGSYLSEGDYFDENWQRSFWGDRYDRLLAVKDRVDPDGSFIVHHGVGSERWSADGFTRKA